MGSDQRMIELLDNLAAQTRVMSSVAQMRRTAAYQQIIAHGQAAVPDLLDALSNHHPAVVPIMAALADITGADPVPPPDRGRVSKMALAWLRWANINRSRTSAS
jgi:hypothetical protein